MRHFFEAVSGPVWPILKQVFNQSHCLLDSVASSILPYISHSYQGRASDICLGLWVSHSTGNFEDFGSKQIKITTLCVDKNSSPTLLLYQRPTCFFKYYFIDIMRSVYSDIHSCLQQRCNVSDEAFGFLVILFCCSFRYCTRCHCFQVGSPDRVHFVFRCSVATACSSWPAFCILESLVYQRRYWMSYAWPDPDHSHSLNNP